MERDFMGLNSKESVITVKEETVDGCVDSGSGVPWLLAKKASTIPQFMFFNGAQEEKAVKIMHNPLACSGFTSFSTADAFNTVQKRSNGEIENFVGGTIKQQSPQAALPYLGSVGGVAEPWFNSKASAAPAQLTIFYSGMVNVYDDISPEKAQAIMFLAGNGASNLAQPRAQIQAPTSKLAGGDGVHVNSKSMHTPPCSGLSSPISVTSHPVCQSASGSPNNDEVMVVKSTVVSTTSVSKVDTPKIVSSIGPVTATAMIPSAVPQARKASLARFLEKRKERVMNSAPYNLSNPSPECTTMASNGLSFSAGSGLLANNGKESNHNT